MKKKTKIILWVAAILIALFAIIGVANAQDYAVIQEQYRLTLMRLIELLIEQVKQLQAQLALVLAQQAAIPEPQPVYQAPVYQEPAPAPVPAPAPAIVPIIKMTFKEQDIIGDEETRRVPALEHANYRFTYNINYRGEYQKFNCSLTSPEFNAERLGSGARYLNFDTPGEYQYRIACYDLAGLVSSKTLTVSVIALTDW